MGDLGFKLETIGVHVARSSMFGELELLLATVPPDAPRDSYRRAVIDQNCLAKTTASNRALTWKQLVRLYGFDSQSPVFRGLRFFWGKDPAARPALGFLAALARDSILRLTTPVILNLEVGQTLHRELTVASINKHWPRRFSQVSCEAIATRLATTWTSAGLLTGKATKLRSSPLPTPASAAYAMYLAHLSGLRGPDLFTCQFVVALACPQDTLDGLLRDAARRGWMVLNRLGEVVEVAFPQLEPLPKEAGHHE